MLFDSLNFIILVLTLCTIQSILGIGVLVIGTPILLIFNFQIIEIMFLLLPISIMTSVVNILISKFDRLKYFSERKKKFLLTFFFNLLTFYSCWIIILKNLAICI